ncbi:hypothetical protein MNBD_ALPHA01-2229 [hydrothermal vent metagenome]|uniref:Uncharacterized protein n=1 Tax=hydrothermal vent metagenome TaxID=652676 RepID=A0A3B0SL06_9ZZZZ
MIQGNYKKLFFKLSGAALGLVAMLAVTLSLSPDFVPDKTPKADMSRPSGTSPDQRAAILRQEFDIVVEGSMQIADPALGKARIALEELEFSHYEKMVEGKLATIEALNDTMAEITGQMAIPGDLKENILANLEVQLEEVEKKLSKLEDFAVVFSYKGILPQSKYSIKSNCDKADVIIESGDEENSVEPSGRGNQKNSTEAFFWI